MRAVVVGATFVDACFFSVATPTVESPTAFATDAVTCFGGKGYNQAVAARRLGAYVSLLTSVGGSGEGDPLSSLVGPALVAEGFEEGDLLMEPHLGRALSPVAILANGNDVKMVAGNPLPPPTEILRSDAFRDRLAECDVLLSTFDWGEAFTLELLSLLGPRGARRQTVVFNPAPDFDKSWYVCDEIIQKVDWVIPNRREAARMLGESPPDQHAPFDVGAAASVAKGVARCGVPHVVVTCGEHGIVYSDGVDVIVRPVLQKAIRDTTAASDAFCAAVATYVGEGRPLSESLDAGIAAGALASMRLGTSIAMPTADRVRAAVEAGVTATDGRAPY